MSGRGRSGLLPPSFTAGRFGDGAALVVLLVFAALLRSVRSRTSPLSVRASKQSAYQGLGKGSVEEASKASYDQVVAMVKSQDFIEGPRAFAERRKPNWQNR